MQNLSFLKANAQKQLLIYIPVKIEIKIFSLKQKIYLLTEATFKLKIAEKNHQRKIFML